MGPANPLSKRKLSEKTERLSKKPKVMLDSVDKLKVEPKKMTTPLSQGRGKELMTSHVPVIEKPPVLFREDSRYAPEKLLSIISTDYYEDLTMLLKL